LVPEETQLFLAHVDEALRPMVHLVASTGMRRSELLGLTWDNVNLERGVVTIAATVVVVRGENVWQAETTTDRSRRTIAIDPGTVSMLRKHRMSQLEKRMELGETWGNELNLVFTDEIGDIYSPARFTRTFQDEARRLGLTAIGVHRLRHSLATTALRTGVPIKVVAQRLGHSSTSVTMDRYSHVVEEQDREAAVMLAEIIVGTG
jgi:integrase